MPIDVQALISWMDHFFWVLTRVGAMFAVSPVFGGKTAPHRVRLMVTLAVSFFISRQINVPDSIDILSAIGLLVAVEQIAIGFSIGFAMSIVFDAVMIGGEQIGMGMGLGFAQIVDPKDGITVPVISEFFLIASTLIFLSLNGHLLLIALVKQTFVWIPVGALAFNGAMGHNILSLGTAMFAGGALIALPSIVALIVINLSFGIVSKSAANLSIFSIGFPVMLLAGIFITIYAANYFSANFTSVMYRAIEFIGSVLRSAASG